MTNSEYPDLNTVYPAPTATPPITASSEYPTLDQAFGSSAISTPPPQLVPQDTLSKVYHAVIPGITMGVGGTAAGILGAPAGPVGAAAAGIAGGAAMYGPGQQAANAIDQMRGIQTQPTNPIQDTQTGLTAEAAGAALSPILSGAGSAITSGFKKFVSAALGPSEDAISAQMANPDIINSPDFSQLARTMPKTLGILKDRITEATENAASLLGTSQDPEEGAIPATKITGMLQNLSDNLKTSGVFVGPSRQAAANQLSKLTSNISDIMKPAVSLLGPDGQPLSPQSVMLPETTVKDILQAVRNNVNWDDMGLTESNKALTNFSGQLDATLKAGNPDYAAAMKPVSKMMGTLDDVMSDFSLEHPTGKGIQPTDTTISKLQSVLGDKKSFSQDVLNELKAATDVDYMQGSENASYAKQFQGGSAQGSRRVNLFGAMGAAGGGALGGVMGAPGIGAGIGSALGGGVGALADKYGGPMAANVIQHYVGIQHLLGSLSNTIGAEAAKKFLGAAFANEIQGLSSGSSQ